MSKIIIRAAQETDCFEEIAACIYGTDPFIYPTAFGADQSCAVQAITTLMRIPESVLSYRNIRVAEMNNQICGILLFNETGAQWDTEEYYLRVQNYVPNKDHFVYASTHYFMVEAAVPSDNHIEIIAVCVAPDFRGKGIATKLLCAFAEENKGKILQLDVLADNQSAVRLYSHCGFTVTEQYKGFSITESTRPDCFHMIRSV